MIRKAQSGLEWQSKAILLIVVPWTGISVLLQSRWWMTQVPVVAWTTLGISGIFGLIVWRMRAGTLGAAATGALICASLMFSTTRFPYEWSWLRGALPALLTVFLLTFAATKIGKAKKEKLGTSESGRGRNAAQVAANLGVAALVGQTALAMTSTKVMGIQNSVLQISYFGALAALAEAAADTVSSEIGQVFGGTPRMFTTFRRVDAGTDGAITFVGTVAGSFAAATIGVVGLCTSQGIFTDSGWILAVIVTLAGIFGLLFDSLLGATLERKGWLNNDAVNFLSTLSAVAFSIAIVGVLAALAR